MGRSYLPHLGLGVGVGTGIGVGSTISGALVGRMASMMPVIQSTPGSSDDLVSGVGVGTGVAVGAWLVATTVGSIFWNTPMTVWLVSMVI